MFHKVVIQNHQVEHNQPLLDFQAYNHFQPWSPSQETLQGVFLVSYNNQQPCFVSLQSSNKFHIMFINSQIELLKAFKVILFWYFIFQKTPTSSMLKSNNPLNYYEIIEVYSIVSLFMYHLQRMWKELFPKAVWLHHSQI